MKILTLGQVAKAVGGIIEASYEAVEISGISIDTREDLTDKLFIAIKGERFDGHDYIKQAFQKGAACCVSQNEDEEGMLAITVSDTRKALADIARYYKTLFKIPTIAITGSVGKTTTKDMISAVISQKYKVLKTEGNFNNEIGLPLTIFKLNESHEAIVLEMGMRGFGEIHELSRIALPDIAVITNIGVSHIEILGSREGILKAKSEIFDYMEKGSAILNGNDDLLKKLKLKNINTITYGDGCHYWAENVIYNGVNGVTFTIKTHNNSVNVELSYGGSHMVSNALAAAACGEALGLSFEQIASGLKQFKPSNMRQEVFTTANGVTVINDVYNANPVSMKAALDLLKNADGRKVCILGDMLELGSYSQVLHKEIGQYAASLNIDAIICIGSLAKHIYHGSEGSYFETPEQFFKQMEQFIRTGDTVLVKASRSMCFEKIVDRLRGDVVNG